MPQTQEKAKPVFVPRAEYADMFSALDNALFELQQDSLPADRRESAQAMVTSLQAEIALLGDSAGEFVYP